MAEWKSLTRNDLRAFDEDMTKMILYAMDAGGVGRVSNNGHAILRNSTGQTMSVSRSASGGSRKQNVARDLTRLFGCPVEQKPAVHRTAGTAALAAVPEPAHEQIVRCIAKGCAETFVTEGARYSHVEREHFRCREDGCNAAFTTRQGQVGHQRIVHEGHKPRKGKGPKQQAARAAQTAPEPTAPKSPPSVQAETPPAPEPAPKPAAEQRKDNAAALVHEEAKHYDAVEVLERVREALGEDPRVEQLEREVKALRRERDDLKAQLALVREALHLS